MALENVLAAIMLDKISNDLKCGKLRVKDCSSEKMSGQEVEIRIRIVGIGEEETKDE